MRRARAGHERYLSTGESIVLEVRRHPALLLRSFLETVAVIAAAALLGAATSPSRGDDLVDTLLGWVTLVFVVRFMWRGLLWWVDRVVVTDQRMVEVSGVLSKKVASMPLSKLTDLTYRRSVPGRLLGYGDLVVETPGQEQALTHIDFLPHPDDFYRTLTALVMQAAPRHPAQAYEDAFDHADEDTGPLPRVIV